MMIDLSYVHLFCDFSKYFRAQRLDNFQIDLDFL